MNPLDEKLNQAIQDYRDQTTPAIDSTRRYVLARMRRERLQRWILGGGSVALLSLVLYFVLDRAEPLAQRLPIAEKAVDAGEVNPADRSAADRSAADDREAAANSDAMEVTQTVKTDSMHPARAEAPPPPQAQKRSTSNSALTYAITHDAFVDESIALTRRASDAVTAENLPLAAESYRGLARLCEKRMEWKRAVAAYDSAVSYANRIGDTHLLQDLTREQALASKKVVKRK